MNYYEHHLGDWAKKCGSLSLIEEGAYRRLLDLYYIAEGPLPADLKQLFKDARAHKKTEKDAISFVLRRFFVLTDRGYLNERAEQEIARFQSKSQKAKESANARWAKENSEAPADEARYPNDATAYATASVGGMRTHSEGNAPRARPQSPVTSNHLSLIPSTLSGAPARPPVEAAAVDLLGDESPKAWEPPDCPHLQILEAWKRALPEMPQHLVAQWKGTRAVHLRTRWRETAVEEQWLDAKTGVEWFEGFFRWLRGSPWLMGKKPGRDGRAFELELAWLVNPTNWAKAREGKYHGS